MLDETGKPVRLTWTYSRDEMVADAVVHLIGGLFALGAAISLVILCIFWASAPQFAGVMTYVVSLIAALGASAAYNMWPISRTKWLLRRFDHAAIFVLIAGTYTPFLILLPSGLMAGVTLLVIWLAAAAGIALKVFLPGQFERLSIGLYLALGWSGTLIAGSVWHAVPPATVWLVAIGGGLYSAGVVFHVWRTLKFQNAIWHGFVLVAAACHFAAVVVSVTGR